MSTLLRVDMGKSARRKKLCPGVFRILTVPIPLDQFYMLRLICGNGRFSRHPTHCKILWDTAGIIPEVLVVYCNADYFDKSRWVMTYEIDKYLVDHNFPLPDGESLLEVRVRGMESARSILESSRSRPKLRGALHSSMTVWQMGFSG